jgi:hypothetical protein
MLAPPLLKDTDELLGGYDALSSRLETTVAAAMRGPISDGMFGAPLDMLNVDAGPDTPGDCRPPRALVAMRHPFTLIPFACADL